MHRLRSSLTALGIIFGVCSVIAMLAIGEGASMQAQESIARLGSTNLIIESVKPPDEKGDTQRARGATAYGLTYTDAESIRNTVPNVNVIVPIRELNHKARYRNRKAAIKIIGTIPWYPQIVPLRLISGRFLTGFDIERRLNICVVDEGVARSLFTFDNPIGKDIRIQGSFYRVVGLVGTQDPTGPSSSFGNSTAAVSGSAGGVVGNIYMPVTTAKSRFIEIDATFSGGDRSLNRVELQKIIVKVESNDHVLATRNIIANLLDRLHEKQDYRIVVPLELLREAARTRRIFSIVLGSIAAISLLVGGIGIMNIMLATVSERTREIGIRRALGAKKRDIIIQFLSETLLLTLTGGILGIILGSIIPFLVTYFTNMPTIITPGSLIAAFGVSAMVGITSGLYPAYRAANMDPIESLRHE